MSQQSLSRSVLKRAAAASLAAFVLAFALVLYPMLRGDLRISRREGGLLLAAFAGWVVLEIALLA